MDRLLDLLHEDARRSVAQMATMLGEDVEAVQKRLADYEKRGVIRGYQAVVNSDMLDDGVVHAVIELRIRPAQDGGFDKIANRIGRFSQVDMGESEAIDDPTAYEEVIEGGGSTYIQRGTVYQDAETGQFYMIENN